MARKRAKRQLESYQANGETLRPGVCVLLRAPDPNTPPYIARVEKIEADSSNRVTMQCRWYYRPEDSIGGRRQFHGSKELFLSDHCDRCHPEAVESTCRVHSFAEYTTLSTVEEEDYFCRFEYKAATGTFMPDRVAVYCTCEMPYNPDELMIQCEKCRDWFHPACVRLPVERVHSISHYTCPECT
ncbi:unnamed protein product [Closterium sp. NIES-53]